MANLFDPKERAEFVQGMATMEAMKERKARGALARDKFDLQQEHEQQMQAFREARQSQIVEHQSQMLDLQKQQFESISAVREAETARMQADIAEKTRKIEAQSNIDKQRYALYSDPDYDKLDPRSSDFPKNMASIRAKYPDAFDHDPGVQKWAAMHASVNEKWNEENAKILAAKVKDQSVTGRFSERQKGAAEKLRVSVQNKLAESQGKFASAQKALELNPKDAMAKESVAGWTKTIQEHRDTLDQLNELYPDQKPASPDAPSGIPTTTTAPAATPTHTAVKAPSATPAPSVTTPSTTDPFQVGKRYKDPSGNTATYKGNGVWE